MFNTIFNVIKLPRNGFSQSSIIRAFSLSTVSNNSEQNQTSKPKLKEWREKFKNPKEKPLLALDAEGAVFQVIRTQVELTPWGIQKFLKGKIIEREKLRQSFNPMRHKILGSDLACAHFLAFRGGKLKFKGNDNWITVNEDQKTINLPNKFDPNYVLLEIDASGLELYYEALDNFTGLPRVKKINFARSPHFDDWFVDKISSLFPYLEYLNISDCPKVTERALEALYRLSNLKTLIVTNYHNTAAFELTCMMLEDCLPDLKIEVCDTKGNRKTSVKYN